MCDGRQRSVEGGEGWRLREKGKGKGRASPHTCHKPCDTCICFPTRCTPTNRPDVTSSVPLLLHRSRHPRSGDLGVAISCASMAVANAGIDMFDLVAGCTVVQRQRDGVGAAAGAAGELSAELVLDPTSEDIEQADASLSCALMPTLRQVTHLVQEGEMDLQEISEVRGGMEAWLLMLNGQTRSECTLFTCGKCESMRSPKFHQSLILSSLSHTHPPLTPPRLLRLSPSPPLSPTSLTPVAPCRQLSSASTVVRRYPP